MTSEDKLLSIEVINNLMARDRNNCSIAMELTKLITESHSQVLGDKIYIVSKESIFSLFDECCQLVDEMYPVKSYFEESMVVLKTG